MTNEQLDEEILELNLQNYNAIQSLHTMAYGGFADARDITDIGQKEQALDDLKEANEKLLEAYRSLIGIEENYEIE